MFEIRKEVINSVGNVQSSVIVGYLNCTKDDIIKHIIIAYHNLACTDNLQFEIRGKSNRVRYIFTNIEVKDITTAINYAVEKIKSNVAKANEYIKTANAAYKDSNRKRGIKDKSLAIKEVKVEDYLWNKDAVYIDADDYIIVE